MPSKNKYPCPRCGKKVRILNDGWTDFHYEFSFYVCRGGYVDWTMEWRGQG